MDSLDKLSFVCKTLFDERLVEQRQMIEKQKLEIEALKSTKFYEVHFKTHKWKFFFTFCTSKGHLERDFLKNFNNCQCKIIEDVTYVTNQIIEITVKINFGNPVTYRLYEITK